MRFLIYLWLMSGAASSAYAQFLDFLSNWPDAGPSDTRPVTAEITATLKARTPWGEITKTESGKYWRNSLGQDRFDNAYGVSDIRDERGPVLHARIDRNLRLVEIEERTGSAAGTDPRSVLPFSYGKPGKGAERTLEGLPVIVRTGEDGGVSYEVWTEDRLGIALLAKYKTAGTAFEQRIHNLRFAQPNPELFKIEVPESFQVHITCWSPVRATWEAPRQTYRPGDDPCKEARR